MATIYSYKSLQLLDSPNPWSVRELRSIRLIMVLAGEGSADLQSILFPAMLPESYRRPGPNFGKNESSGEQSPLDYEALSYTWGVAAKTQKLLVKSGIPIERTEELTAPLDDLVEKTTENEHWQVIEITESLHSALQNLRLKDKHRLMWIDAVCINQDNQEERTQQVKIMDRIYSHAVQVIVWLGEASTHASVSQPNTELSKLGATDCMITGDSDFAIQSLKAAAGGRRFNQAQLKAARAAVERLLTRPWWKRAWVVQEVLMARQCLFTCGTASITWEEMGNGIDVVEPFPSEAVTEWSRRGSDFRRPMLWNMKANLGMSLIMQMPYLLGHFQTRACTDPRDKIFSLVSLVAAGPNVRQDYAMSTCEVYSEVVRRCVLHKPSLSIITRHHSGFDPDGPNILNLPSWVPDFSRSDGDGSLSWTMSTEWYYKELYYADGRFNLEGITDFAFLDPFKLAPDVMLGQGAYLDRLASVSDAIPDEAYEEDADGTNSECWLHHMRQWEPPCVAGDEKYEQTGESALRAYWRTLVMDKHDLKWRYSHLSDKFAPLWRRDLMYLTCMKRVCFGFGSEQDKLLEKFISILRRSSRGRRFGVTEKGYFALVPQTAAIGDIVTVLLGGSAPFVLREMSPRTETELGSYRMLGISYVHGWMDGEIIRKLKHREIDGHFFPIY